MQMATFIVFSADAEDGPFLYIDFVAAQDKEQAEATVLAWRPYCAQQCLTFTPQEMRDMADRSEVAEPDFRQDEKCSCGRLAHACATVDGVDEHGDRYA